MFVCVCELSRGQLFATPRTVALQASLSMEFSRQEYWSRLLFPSSSSLVIAQVILSIFIMENLVCV